MSLLGRLQRAYKAAGLNCGNKLRAPARLEVVRNLGRLLDLPIPPSLRAVWRIHGGQGYVTPGTTGLFGSHRLHSPSETAENYQMFLENNLDPSGKFPPADGKIGYFHPRLLPFASWDVYNLCIDTASGMVWEFSPNYGTRGGTSRPSLRGLVSELLALLAAGREPELDFIYGPRKKVVS
jgi:cell wall assembly regulator SMI1